MTNDISLRPGILGLAQIGAAILGLTLDKALSLDTASIRAAAGLMPTAPQTAPQPTTATAKVPTSAPSPVRNLANSDPELPELAPLTPANEGMDLLAFADSLDASRVIS